MRKTEKCVQNSRRRKRPGPKFFSKYQLVDLAHDIVTGTIDLSADTLEINANFQELRRAFSVPGKGLLEEAHNNGA